MALVASLHDTVENRMKAIAVLPGTPDSVHLAELAKPSLEDVPDGRGLRDMSQAEAEYPGWLGRLLTHPVHGLANYRDLLDKLQNPAGAIKTFCEVTPS